MAESETTLTGRQLTRVLAWLGMFQDLQHRPEAYNLVHELYELAGKRPEVFDELAPQLLAQVRDVLQPVAKVVPLRGDN